MPFRAACALSFELFAPQRSASVLFYFLFDNHNRAERAEIEVRAKEMSPVRALTRPMIICIEYEEFSRFVYMYFTSRCDQQFWQARASQSNIRPSSFSAPLSRVLIKFILLKESDLSLYLFLTKLLRRITYARDTSRYSAVPCRIMQHNQVTVCTSTRSFAIGNRSDAYAFSGTNRPRYERRVQNECNFIPVQRLRESFRVA